MKFSFKIQQYQTDAVDAVVRVFKGQDFSEETKYIRDLGTLPRKAQKEVLLPGAKDSSQEDSEDILSTTGFKN